METEHLSFTDALQTYQDWRRIDNVPIREVSRELSTYDDVQGWSLRDNNGHHCASIERRKGDIWAPTLKQLDV